MPSPRAAGAAVVMIHHERYTALPAYMTSGGPREPSATRRRGSDRHVGALAIRVRIGGPFTDGRAAWLDGQMGTQCLTIIRLPTTHHLW